MTAGGTRRAPTPVGVLGGSFDPVHLAHLRVAEAVRGAFSISRVLLVPSAIPPHKAGERISAAEHRLAMLRLSVEDRPGLEIDTVELDRGGVSYTIDTLRGLRQRGLNPMFILGMDSLSELPSWKDPDALIEQFDLIVVDRPGRPSRDPIAAIEPRISERLVAVGPEPGAAAALLADRPETGGVIYRLLLEPLDISSSRIRRRARDGAPLDGLVPPAVARYIQAARLYGQEEAR